MKEEAEIIERFRAVSDNVLFRKKHFRYTKIRLYLLRKRAERIIGNAKAAIKTSVTLKTLLRSPLRTALTFALIAAASFALFSRVTDYAITTREMKRAESYYHGVASLDESESFVSVEVGQIMTEDGNISIGYGYTKTEEPWASEESLKELEGLPGVSLIDKRYLTAGFVEDYKRLSSHQDTISFVLECTYAGYENMPGVVDEVNPYINIKLDDVKVLACDDNYEVDSSVVLEQVYLADYNFADIFTFSRDFYDSLEIGSRCLVVVTHFPIGGPEFILNSALKERAFCVIDNALGENYLETEEYADIRNLIDAIRQNYYVYDVVYTSDTRAIPCFNERDMLITQGHHITREDARACVVSEDFLREHGLAVGDTIHVRLGDSIESTGINAKAYKRRTETAAEADLEIAGVFQIPIGLGDEFHYDSNTIFVPKSLLPAEVSEDHKFSQGEYSVFAENARDITEFREAMEDAAVRLHLGLYYSDGGWASVKEGYEMGFVTSLLTTTAYAVASMIALFLAVYLYIGRNRKSYAILRMLGMPGNISGHSLTIPFVALAALAIPSGVITGLFYAKRVAEKTILNIMDDAPAGYILNVELPIRILVGCLIFELVFISVMIQLFLKKMKKTPPLQLVQDGIGYIRTGRKKRQEAAALSSFCNGLDTEKISIGGELPVGRNHGSVRHTFSYVFRHIRRGIGKTAVTMALTIVLTAGIGLLVMTRLTYRDIYEKMDVKGKAMDFCSDSVEGLAKSPLVKDLYCYGDFSVYLPDADESAIMNVTNDPDKYLEYQGDVTYEDGYGISNFEGTGQICIIGKELADRLHASVGDEINMISLSVYNFLTEQDIRGEQMTKRFQSYRVIGIVESDDFAVNTGIVTGLRSNPAEVCGKSFPLSYCEFLLADNTKSVELNERLEQERIRSLNYSKTASYHLDVEALHNIERICHLLDSLFPIAMAAAVMIGLTGSLLIILQSPLEAVLLRALGVTKKRVRCMLVLEQVILCAVGILFVTCGIVLSRPEMFLQSCGTLAGCYGLYFWGCVCGTFAAAIQVTRYRILELLQTRE